VGHFKAVGETTWASLLPATGTTPPAIHGLVLEAASGTGKTTEVEGQAERLRTVGVTAFFCTAKRIASSGLAAALDQQLRDFRAWQASTHTAVMFVDAVDEVYLDGSSASDLFRELEKEIDFVVAEIVLVVTVRTGSPSKKIF